MKNKKLEDLKWKLKNIRYSIDFYRYNLGSIPQIRKVLCKINQHDFELEEIVNNTRVILKCFYCGHEKSTCLSFKGN